MNIEHLDNRNYLVSPFVRDPIPSNLPDNILLIKDRNTIRDKRKPEHERSESDRDELLAAAKKGDREAANQVASAMDRAKELLEALEKQGPLPKRVGILYPDRPKDQPKNQIAVALAEEMARRLSELRPDISWEPMPAYQIQQKSRTVFRKEGKSDPLFETRSRFMIDRHDDPKSLPEGYILTDYICAKGDTLADMVSLVNDTIARVRGDAKVLGIAVMKSDYPNLAPSKELRQRFDEALPEPAVRQPISVNDPECLSEREALERSLMHIGLNVESLTHGQMDTLLKERDKNPETLRELYRRVRYEHVGEGPLVPEPSEGEKEWVLRERGRASKAVAQR